MNQTVQNAQKNVLLAFQQLNVLNVLQEELDHQSVSAHNINSKTKTENAKNVATNVKLVMAALNAVPNVLKDQTE
jgi:hypothetical protein